MVCCGGGMMKKNNRNRLRYLWPAWPPHRVARFGRYHAAHSRARNGRDHAGRCWDMDGRQSPPGFWRRRPFGGSWQTGGSPREVAPSHAGTGWRSGPQREWRQTVPGDEPHRLGSWQGRGPNAWPIGLRRPGNAFRFPCGRLLVVGIWSSGDWRSGFPFKYFAASFFKLAWLAQPQRVSASWLRTGCRVAASAWAPKRIRAERHSD